MRQRKSLFKLAKLITLRVLAFIPHFSESHEKEFTSMSVSKVGL